MGLRLMATYRGVPYQAGLGPDGGGATLFSPGPPPEELGFTAAAGHWRKQVRVTDLDALWQSRPLGDYRGEPCLVLDDLGDRLHIAYLGRDAARAAQLGYWEIDREVFEVVVARGDVTGLTEERVDFALTAAMFGASGPSAPEPEPTGYGFAEPAGYAEPDGFAEPGGFAEPDGFAEPTGFAAANGNPGLPEKTRPEAYHDPAINGGPTGNGQLTGYGGTDHASRMPDRMTAWHGSPEPWPGPRTSPGPSRGPRTSRGRIRGPSANQGRHPRCPRYRAGAPGARTASPRSRSSPNCCPWPPSRRPRTPSTRRYRARCAWSRRTAASRCSAGPRTRDWRCTSSRTRKRPTFTCSACWPPRRSAVAASGPTGRRGSTDITTDPLPRARPGHLRLQRKTFRSTYDGESDPTRHLVRLGFI